MPDKKLLVICNTFPPAPGIGGRRWAKFSKYLAQAGFEIHVAYPENLQSEISQWNKDIEAYPSIKRHLLYFKHRSLFLKPGNTLHKIRRKITSIRLGFTRYSQRFLTSLPNEETWDTVKNIIEKENIKAVFVSGDPFLYYYACKLKKSTGSRIILDYRDLWNDHSYYRNFYKLNRRQRRFFEDAENTALRECDAIITVDEHLAETLEKRMQGTKDKIVVIHNGYDEDDFKNIIVPAPNTGKVVLYFAGNIASDLNAIARTFAYRFAELKQHRPDLYEKIEIHIKGKMDLTLYNELKSLYLQNLIVENIFVPIDIYNHELAEATMGIVILGKEYAHSYTTKFSDYLFLNKRILVLGCPGKFSEFVLANNYGDLFNPEKDSWKFFEKLIDTVHTAPQYSQDIRRKFNIKNLVKQVISVYEKHAA